MTLVEHTLHAGEQLCFIHIPKTAGTTLIALLDAHFQFDRICPVQLWRELAWLPSDALSQYQLLRGHYTYDDYLKLASKPVFISMFRNPIDRACSYYNFMRNQSEDWLERHYSYRDALAEQHPQVAALVEGDIEIYQRANRDDLPTFFASSFVQTWIQNWHVRSLTRSTFDQTPWDEAAILTRAKERLDSLVWFGLVEQFEASMDLLSYTFGWNPIQQYQRLMVAPNPNYTEGLPSQTLDILRDIHQLDQAFYDYAAQQFTERYAAMQQQLQKQYASLQGTDHGMIHSWLEQHYRDRTQALSLPRQPRIDLTFDQAIAGTGWHLREGNAEEGTLFRWTGPETVSTLNLPLASGQAFTLKLRIVGAISEGVLDSLRVSVGEHEVPLTQLYRELRPGIYLVLVEGVIPADAIPLEEPFTRLTFTVNETRSLHSLDLSNPDRRPIGVAINWISVFPYAERGEDGYCYMLFPGHDPAWLATAHWLRSHANLIHQVIAPVEFAEVLTNQTIPYDACELVEPRESDWFVVHKGMLDSIPLTHLDKVQADWTPVFANAVFVVFTTRPGVEAIAPDHPDLASFQADYIARFNVREDEDYRYSIFPGADPAWDAVARWLRSHRSAIAQVIAPDEFVEVLPNQVTPYNAAPEQLPSETNWIVVHKGMLEAIPLPVLKQVESRWNPVYANGVFVVLTTQPEISAIAAKNPDLLAFRSAYKAIAKLGDSVSESPGG